MDRSSSEKDEEEPLPYRGERRGWPWEVFDGSRHLDDNHHHSNDDDDDLVGSNNNSVASNSEEDDSNEPVLISVPPPSFHAIGTANEDRPHQQPGTEDGEQDRRDSSSASAPIRGGTEGALEQVVAEGYLARDLQEPQEERISLPTAVPADANDEFVDQQEYDKMEQ